MSLEARFKLQRDDFELNVDLRLPSRGVSAIFGASGSGKTTLLRCIAGLEREATGRCQLGDTVWQAAGMVLPTHRRRIGYVFQEAGLLPHLTVGQQLAFATRRAPRDGLDLLGDGDWLRIQALRNRRPDALSGGERQRAAIAVALASCPQLLLMDEPLASLDIAHKREILPFLEELHSRVDLPVLYVTHSLDEVARLADHVVILESGKVLGSGAVGSVLVDPALADRFADEAGAMIEATVVERDPEWHLVRVAFTGGEFWVADSGAGEGERVRIRVLARDVSLALGDVADSSILNRVRGVVTGITEERDPAMALVSLDASGTPLLARITRRSAHRLRIESGLVVTAQVKSVAIAR